ncbi:hypothetical protein [Iningainema tapete]|uniref:Uncharacterized protein n=1 Tax=Iningainema tapete BLCC-T55 TaxID=2748662 RepID=A0A8J7BXX3_9CYAN|nr:hypothetical protein [Iningainema tapete]MBD2774572.1 hypothetical protein [Iningainema tapete BLCC-T55]
MMEFFTWDESKKIKQAIVQQGREFVFAVLETRFEYVSSYVTKVINRINDLAALKRLHKKAVTVDSLGEFEQFVRHREYAVDEYTAKIRNLWNFKISPIPVGYILQLWDPQNRHFWHRKTFKSYKKAENFAKTLIRVCPYGIDILAQHRINKTLLPRLMYMVGTNFIIYQGWMVEIGRIANHGYTTVAYNL